MPAAIPLVAAAAGAAATSAGVFGATLLGSTFLATMANSAIGFVVSTAINQIGSKALGKKPKGVQTSDIAQGRSQIIRSPVDTHKIVYGQTRVSGPLVFVKTVNNGISSDNLAKSGDNKFLHMVIALAGHECEEIGTIYINDMPTTLVGGLDGHQYVGEAPYFGGGISRIRIIKHLGASDQEADPSLISECGLTDKHRLRGICYVYARLEYSADAFPFGIPNISAVVKGKKVYDPRTTLTAWTDNSALCVRDYLINECDVASSRISDTYAIASANICEEAVGLNRGGTQERYTCNGVLDTGASRKDNLTALLSSMAGDVVRVGSEIRIYAAAYETPAGAITDDMLAGDIKLRGKTPRDELINTIKGTYVDPNKNWQGTDFPQYADTDFILNDGGVYEKDLDLPFTTSAEAAQRIAKIIMRKARQGMILEVALKQSALKYSVMDVVTYTQETLGWVNKEFRVRSFKMPRLPDGEITMVLQEESSDSYDWSSIEDNSANSAPDTNLANPFIVAAPGVPSIVEELYDTRGSAGVKAKANVSWAASTDAFVRDYQVEYRLTTASTYSVAGRTDGLTLEVFDINPGRYVFRVKALSTLGVSSEYATANPKEIYGLLARPADVSGLTIQTVSSLAVLRWTRHPDLDVRNGGKIHIRHSEATTGATWEQSYSITTAVSGDTNSVIVNLKAGTYLVKAEDTSGLTSVNAVTVTTKNASVLTFSDLETIQEDTAFSGSHSSTRTDGGVLMLAGGGLFDDIPDFDEVSSLDNYGGVVASGTYSFASGRNNGAVSKVRVESSLQVVAVNVNDLIDSRTANIDEWLDFDGTLGGGSVDAWVECRETDDDPTGSPVWGEWQRVDAADFENWGMQFRARLTSDDPAYNINVTQLRTVIKEIA